MRTVQMLVAVATTVASSVSCAADARAKILRPAVQLAEPRASHSTSPLADGRLLVVGGFRKGPDGYSQIYSATTEIIDPVRATVKPGPPLHHARGGHAAVSLVDGRILVMGGWDADGLVRTSEIYDPRVGRFSDAGDLAEARGGFAAVRLDDGRVLVCGGGDPLGSRTAEIFDPADGRFHATGAMGTARIGHTATLLDDGRVLVAGGQSEHDHVLASAEIYDPAKGTFAAAGSLDVARYKHAAVRLADGRVLVVGGSGPGDWTEKLDTTELFDPATDRFTPGPALTVPRFKLPHAVTMIGGDVVAVAGGAPTVELVDTAHASRTIARLGRSSYYGTATLVGDRLVIVGGYDDHVRMTRAVWFVTTSP